MPSTIKLHRVFKTTPDRLYKAFIDAGIKVAVVEIAQNIMRMLRGAKK